MQEAYRICSSEWHLLFMSMNIFRRHFEDGLTQNKNWNFESDVLPILDGCKKLDEAAKEKEFRVVLSNIFLLPLLGMLNHDSDRDCLEKTEHYIKTYLSFGDYGQIFQPALFSHKAENFKEYQPNDLQDLRETHLKYLLKNPDQYHEAAIVYIVIDYWRVLKSGSYSIFKNSEIKPLLVMGEDLLVMAQQSQSLRLNELRRIVLLLQALLYDHPKINMINLSDWPRYGFVYCLRIPEMQQDHDAMLVPPSPLLKDYKPSLQKSREVFTRESIDVLVTQQEHTALVIEMLQEMILAASDVLGNPPCAIAICALGSTSRYDRRPYSDLELMVLHSEPDKAQDGEERKSWEAHVTVYIYHLITLLELMIVRLGETPNFKSRVEKHEAGFHLDSSCHVLLKDRNQRVKWGTPRQIVERYFIEAEVVNQKEETHLWMDDANFHALLQPILLHPGKLGGDGLLRDYQDCLIPFLNTAISVKDLPDFIAAKFNFKTDGLVGLTRRQGIALVCVRDIIHKSESILNVKKQSKIKFRVGDKVNIKDTHAKPLSYCALNLQLFFNWPNASPLRQMEHYTQSLSWGGEAIFIWWKAALSYIAEQQAKLHLQSGHQEEEVNYVPGENADFFAGMDLIFRGFILPLQKHILQCLEGLTRLEHVGYTILISYLNVRDHWLRDWVKKGIDRGSLLNHPLMQALSTYPDVSGWSPMMELILQKHIHALSSLSQSNITACQFAGLPGDTTTNYLREDLVASCFDIRGEFKGDPELSGENSEVKKINGKQSWFIKVKSGNEKGLMGREYLAMMLHLLLGGEPQVALGWPVMLRYTNNVISKRVCAWLSEGIGGESLADVMRNSPQKLRKENMDIESFSQLFLLSFLTCPEDGQPENFRVLERSGKTRLVAIDYGQCFVQAERTHKSHFRKATQVLTIKTMIYLLESMDEPLSADIITRLRILNINKWYLEAYQSVNRRYNPLGDKDLPLIKLENEVLACIKTRLELLQHWIRTTQKAITGNNILMDLEPLVALQYQSKRGLIKTPEDFYTKLDLEAYKPNAKGKMVSSATYTLIRERTITPQHLVRSCDLEASYFRNINFHHLNDCQQQYTLALFESVAQTKGKQFFKLNLSGCRVINQDRLISLLEKMNYLEVLDIRECSELSAITLCEIFSHRPHATILTYNYDVLCPDLMQINFTLEGNERSLKLRLDRLARQKLTVEMRKFLKARRQLRVDLLRPQSTGYSDLSDVEESLRKLGDWDEETRKAFVVAMDNKNVEVSLAASASLGNLGYCNEEFLSVLLAALGHENWLVRYGAAKSLGKLGHKNDVIRRTLLKAMRDDKVRVQLEVAASLSRLYPGDKIIQEDFYNLLLKALSADDMQMCLNYAMLLGKLIHDDDVIFGALVKKALEDESRDNRSAAVEMLGILFSRNEEIRLILLKAMKDNYPKVSRKAIEAIGRQGYWDEEIREVLLEATSSADIEIRETAIVCLAKYGQWDEGIRAAWLKALRDDKEISVKHAARKWFESWNPCDNVNRAIMQEMLDDQYIDVRMLAVSSLGRASHWDEKTRVTVLKLSIRESKFWDVCLAGIKSLVKLGHWDKEIQDILLKALMDTELRIRCEAARLLGDLGYRDEEIRVALLKVIEEGHELLMIEAARTLGTLGYRDGETKAFWLTAIHNKNSELRRTAAQSLGIIGHEDMDIRKSLIMTIKGEYNRGMRIHDSWIRYEAAKSLAIFPWDKEIADSLLDMGEEYHVNFFTLTACIRQIEYYIKSLPINDASPLSDPEHDKILKRIFFFANDNKSRRAIPCVSHKWRSLYQEFIDEQRLQMAPELQLSQVINDNNSGTIDSTDEPSVSLDSVPKKF